MDTATETARPPLVLPPSMTAQQVAEALQITIGHFYSRRAGLEAAGFPRKLPGTERWSRRAVNDWIESGGQP